MSIPNESVHGIADDMLELANKLQEKGKLPPNYTADDLARDLRDYANRLHDANYMERLAEHRKFLDETAHDEGDLAQWYIDSVIPTDKPVWTKEHLEELVQDYWMIPKPMDERFKKPRRKKGGKA